MMRRCSNTSSPLAAAVLLLFLMACFFHCAAAARLLPAAVAPLVHQENGAKAAAVDGLLVLQDGAAVTGDELPSVSEVRTEEVMVGAEEAEEPATETECEEGNDDCLQRRLLRDAHLDYIYTQHKGKP
ncbi:phytosulfokines 5-like [Panicum miliaceum]|uniref:Phytosulfokine n=1 Tax=Panicum miliaceum TaxID=4540 RepID=A0A3L6SUP2_PANMI|nr:phytosulfokines 5-like [Panicum miliaceum]